MMGAGLVKAAFALADADRFQDHRSMRLFAYMALTARDADPRPSFFGGQDALLRAIAGTESSAVRQSLRRLREVGYVVLDENGKAHTGRRSTYFLEDGTGSPLALVDNSNLAVRIVPPVDTTAGTDHTGSPVREAVRTAPRGGTDRTGQAVRSVPPKEEEEREEETRASAPARTCLRHPNWEHSEPCRACAVDRRAAEATRTRRAPTTMSPRVIDCGPGKHRWLPNGTCNFCESRDPLWDVA
ncbi:hypothetical protein M2317_001322 [Microbacterium sp. ZKA21]|uniref:hypothetical protein n=1 Tax=Microbacterium sp. ZKA21 TaxID=3381694 RepID=UPI003D1D1FEC